MLKVMILCVGSLKEAYLRDAAAEYAKRLSAFCDFSVVELKEYRLPDDPSEGEIRVALAEEAERLEKAIPPRAYRIALCVEGRQMSSEALAGKIGSISAEAGCIVFIIGSSHGLAGSLKETADLKLSVSELTFPHQLMRVLLPEILYRSFQILKGTKYHK